MPQALFVGLIPLFSISAALALSLGAAAPAPGGALAVVVPPWHSAEAVVTAAGGVLLPVPGAPLSVQAAGAGPDFADRLRAAGAWAVLPADATSFLCKD
ncbi:MAG: hypothetical protein ACXIUV_09005 [Alkalilacustris sp.]